MRKTLGSFMSDMVEHFKNICKMILRTPLVLWVNQGENLWLTQSTKKGLDLSLSFSTLVHAETQRKWRTQRISLRLRANPVSTVEPCSAASGFLARRREGHWFSRPDIAQLDTLPRERP